MLTAPPTRPIPFPALAFLVLVASAVMACTARAPEAPPANAPLAATSAPPKSTISETTATATAIAPSIDAGSTRHSPTFRATAAMSLDGQIVGEKLVAEVNRQIDTIAPCVALVRKTDTIVGSLNVRMHVAKEGLTPELESPVNPDAKRCIIEGMRRWSSVAAGHGSAMVLLSIEDGSPGYK